MFCYESFTGEQREAYITFDLEFQFESVNLRKVLLLWKEKQNTAASDFTFNSDKQCCQWIHGLLKTIYGKTVIWPYENTENIPI